MFKRLGERRQCCRFRGLTQKKPFLLRGLLIAVAALAWSVCQSNGTRIFYCNTENASCLQLCLRGEPVQFLGGPDLTDLAYDLSMPKMSPDCGMFKRRWTETASPCRPKGIKRHGAA